MQIIKLVKKCTKEKKLIKFFVIRDNMFDIIRCDINIKGDIVQSRYVAEYLKLSELDTKLSEFLDQGYLATIELPITTSSFIKCYPYLQDISP